MNASHLRLHAPGLLAIVLVGLAAPTFGQNSPPSGVPDRSPAAHERFLREQAVEKDAHAIEIKARKFLVARDFVHARAQIESALRRLDALYEGYAMPTHEILAEIELAQGDYGTALAEIRKSYQTPSGRQEATEALALVGLGRVAEARPLVARALESSNVPVNLIGDRGDLPAAFDPSADALAATAYLARAAEDEEDVEDTMGVRQDLEAAMRLAPRNPVVALNLGRFYRSYSKRPDLARKTLESARGGSKATQALIARELSRLGANEAKAAGGTGG